MATTLDDTISRQQHNWLSWTLSRQTFWVFVAVVAGEAEEAALAALRAHPLGASARCVGHVTSSRPGTVIMNTRVGGKRVMDFPRGLLLPRIC